MNLKLSLKGKVEQIVQTLKKEGRDTYRLPDLSQESMVLARMLEEDGIRCESPTRHEMMFKRPDERKS